MPELVTAPTFREQVLAHLRERIMSGDLHPGALLTPTAVAKELNTSAMPVREALRTLEREGLVEVSGRRYTRVATPSKEVASEAYPLIALLESHAIRQAEALPPSTYVEAERFNAAQHESTTPTDRMQAMFGFHRAICSAAGPITEATLEMLYARVALLESVYAQSSDPLVAYREHSEIIKALRSEQFEEAARLTQEHWQHGLEDVMSYIAPAPPSTA